MYIFPFILAGTTIIEPSVIPTTVSSKGYESDEIKGCYLHIISVNLWS